MHNPDFIGTEYVTVERPSGRKDRHGDAAPAERHEEGPCSIQWFGLGSSLVDTFRVPIDAVEREFSLIFRFVPDIKQDDRVILPSGRRYSVTNVDVWKSRRNGRVMGAEVRIVGLESGGR